MEGDTGVHCEPEGVELRVRGTVLGVLHNVGGTAVVLEIKKGPVLYSVNVNDAMAYGFPLILERVLRPEKDAAQDVFE